MDNEPTKYRIVTHSEIWGVCMGVFRDHKEINDIDFPCKNVIAGDIAAGVLALQKKLRGEERPIHMCAPTGSSTECGASGPGTREVRVTDTACHDARYVTCLDCKKSQRYKVYMGMAGGEGNG